MREVALFIFSICLTISMELVTLYLLKVRDKRLWFSIIINLCTNALLNSILGLINTYTYIELPLYIVLVILFEICIVGIEGLFYQLITKDKKNFLYSLIANAVSGILGTGVGLLISIFIY
jgi:hypothetical protein